jgi:hypothetical protein
MGLEKYIQLALNTIIINQTEKLGNIFSTRDKKKLVVRFEMIMGPGQIVQARFPSDLICSGHCVTPHVV